MNRFFVKPDDMTEDSAAIIGEDVKHISKVLRMQSGDRVMLSDGCGYEYLAEIETISRERVELKLLDKKPCPAEPKQRITLYQGIPKAGKMELIIQKCVELGINGIIPVAAERSVVRVKPGEYKAKQTRYQRVACEAAKQSGRGIIPQVRYEADFVAVLNDALHTDLPLFMYETGERETIRDAIEHTASPIASAAIITGPEGGFAEFEADMARKLGMHICSMGERILRCETAPVVALTALMYGTGNL